MARIALLQADLRAAARITGALSDRHDLYACSSWAEVAAIAQSQKVDACFVDGEYPPPTKALWWIRKILAEAPGIVLIIATESRDVEHSFALGRLGADGLVVVSADSRSLVSQVDTALQRGRSRVVQERVLQSWPEVGGQALARAIANAGEKYSPDDLATELGFSGGSSLRRVLRKAGLPTPSRLLLWGRLLVAASLLAEDGRSQQSVAFSLGYSTPSALGRAFSRTTGMTLSEAADGFGMMSLLDLLLKTEPRHLGGGRQPARLRRLLAVLLAPMLSACASAGVDRGGIDTLIQSPPVDQFHIGVLAIDAETGDTLYAHNHRRKFIPASNQKILVTAAALSLLGPDFRYSTELWSIGALDDSILDGNLILVPSGDPTMSRRYAPDGTRELEQLASQLRESGIRRVTGSLIVDGSAWDSTTVTPTWEVEDLRYRYGATGSVFAIDEGEIEVIVEGGLRAGMPARVHWSPGAKGFIRPRVSTERPGTSRRIQATYLPESRRVVLEGVIGSGETDTLAIAQRDPAGIAARALSNALGRSGIEVEGGWTFAWDRGSDIGYGCSSGDIGACPSARLMAERVSPRLIEITADILAPSQNWMTEQLIRTLGARLGERGEWSEGLDVMESWLVSEIGIDSADVFSRDGSGMSFYNLVTPRALVRILQEMRASPFGAEYRAAMAEPGEEDSTLEDRLPELEGRVFAKTGTISNVNSMSGYLVGKDGREIIFSILTNATGLPASRVRASVDEIVRALAR